ncbi:hypothetical protein Tco_0026385 [Tanacetum coccineum]
MRSNRKCHIPIDLYPCKVEESMTIKKVGDQTIGVIQRRRIDKEGNVCRSIENGNSWVSVPQTAQENGTLVMKMSVPDVLKTMSIDDLYNNFKIVEQSVKKYVGASSGAQNLAFMTAPSTSSTNDVNTAKPAYEVSLLALMLTLIVLKLVLLASVISSKSNVNTVR